MGELVGLTQIIQHRNIKIMNSIKIVWVILFILIGSCQIDKNNNKPQSQQEKSINQAHRDVTDIKSEVRLGNIESYKELKIVYLDYSSESFLFWALLMANKYDYSTAYLDVFYCLLDSYVGGDLYKLKEMDERTKKMALEYLNIASDKGVKEATEILNQLK